MTEHLRRPAFLVALVAVLSAVLIPGMALAQAADPSAETAPLVGDATSITGDVAAVAGDAAAVAGDIIAEEPSPAPIRTTCEEACRQRYKTAFERCMSGEEPNRAACAAKAEGVVTECLTSCPNVEPAPTCKEACELRGKTLYERCMQGRHPGQVACAEKARAAVNDCIANCPRTNPEPAPTTCKEACELRGKTLYERCIQGREPGQEACAEKARAAVKECIANCPRTSPEPAPTTCDEACHARGKAVYERCVQGREPGQEACAEKARAAVKECIANCPRVAPAPTDCEGACKERARGLLKQCVAEGGTPERCERRAAEFLRTCIAERCPKPEPTTCQDACRMRGKSVFQACMKEEGAVEERCMHRMEQVIGECLQNCPRGGVEPVPEPVPDPAACKANCEKVSQAFLDRCLAGSTAPSPEACRKQAAELMERCIIERCQR